MEDKLTNKNPVGRPPKFSSEKEFKEYLKDNASFWVKEWFGLEDFKIEEEKTHFLKDKFGANKPRIDFVIKANNTHIGIEVKNPTNKYHELSRVISQLLSYAVLFEENGKSFSELAIIVSDYDDILIKVVKRYNLPIRVFIVNREYHAEVI